MSIADDYYHSAPRLIEKLQNAISEAQDRIEHIRYEAVEAANLNWLQRLIKNFMSKPDEADIASLENAIKNWQAKIKQVSKTALDEYSTELMRARNRLAEAKTDDEKVRYQIRESTAKGLRSDVLELINSTEGKLNE